MHEWITKIFIENKQGSKSQEEKNKSRPETHIFSISSHILYSVSASRI